ALSTRNPSPRDCAASRTCVASKSVYGLAGLTSSAMMLAAGSNSPISYESLRHHGGGELTQTCKVSARTSDALYEPEGDRIDACEEHHRDRCCRSLGRERGRGAAGRSDHGHLAADEIGRHCRQLIVMTVGPAVFNRQILPLDITSFFQPW